MRIEDFPFALQPLAGAMPVWRATVDAAHWLQAAQLVRDKGGRLVALWAADQSDRGCEAHMALTVRSGLVWLTLPLAHDGAYPDIARIFPSAVRMQRAVHDLLGVQAAGAQDLRAWLRHGAWPAHRFPLRKTERADAPASDLQDDYPFVTVRGDGVHEIPVGPVHAGTIESGHFRFSVVGERVLRMEERFGYKHKGVEKRFESLSAVDGCRLAGRISGDTTVGYAWAFCMALEAATAVVPPLRAQWLRALLLERERIANHLGDLGALGNDAGMAFGLAQFSRLREDVLRLHDALFGHRLLMDVVVPGGVARDLDEEQQATVRAQNATLRAELTRMQEIYDAHPGLQDRFIAAGRVAPELAARLGACGLVGRASGQSWDLRAQFPCAPYGDFDVRMATHLNGDVAARVTVRFDELFESLRLCTEIVDRMPDGAIDIAVPVAAPGSRGIGWIEAWRGEVLIAIECGANGTLRRVHPHDPSWQNWPVLEHAVLDNIVPDFPLINKSFNLSYSGVDL